jgi:hypothetical protein
MDEQRLAQFLSLPLNSDDVWQGGAADLAELMGLPPEKSPTGAGMILWRCTDSELVHARPMFPDAGRSYDQFVEGLLELTEEYDVPYRPARIDCNDRRLADELNQQLDGSGTVVHFRAKMGDWNAVLGDLAGHLQTAAPPQLPSLRDAGCSDEQIRQFAAAAAAFYRAKPWELLDDT